jgi:hypothetical protein
MILANITGRVYRVIPSLLLWSVLLLAVLICLPFVVTEFLNEFRAIVGNVETVTAEDIYTRSHRVRAFHRWTDNEAQTVERFYALRLGGVRYYRFASYP